MMLLKNVKIILNQIKLMILFKTLMKIGKDLSWSHAH